MSGEGFLFKPLAYAENSLRVCAHLARPPSIRIQIGFKYDSWFFCQLEVERS